MNQLSAHNDWSAGIITDGDANKSIKAVSEMENLDLITDADGQSILRVRPPFLLLTDNGFDSALLPNASHANTTLRDAGSLYYWFQWQSGLGAKTQTNTILAYRSAVTGVSEYYLWRIYSNAPSLSDYNERGTAYAQAAVNTWVCLEGDITNNTDGGILAPDIHISAEGGRVRICAGPKNYKTAPAAENAYRIFMDIVPGNASKPLIESSRTITRGTSTTGDTVTSNGKQYSRLGNGGKVFLGWIYDYGKPYDVWMMSAAALNVAQRPRIFIPHIDAASSGSALVGDWKIAVAPIWDADPQQIGIPYVKWIKQGLGKFSPISVYVEMDDVDITHASPRLYGFAVYAQRVNVPNEEDMDGALRVATILINSVQPYNTASPTVITIDESSLGVLEGAWDSDTGGIDMFVTGTGDGERTTFAMEPEYSCQPRGMIMRKEVQYAWGTEDDPGQSKIRESVLPNLRGSYDVFPKWKVSWIPGCSWAINALAEWDDRIVQIHHRDIYHLEPADPLRSRDGYTHGASTVGAGVPTEFLRTIAIGRRGVFFANYEGIWAFRDGRAENILVGRRLKVWQAYSEAVRATAIGGYHNEMQEYWIAFQTTAGNDTTWRIWIWSDTDVEMKSWRDYVVPGVGWRGFFNDEDNTFCGWGIISGAAKLIKFAQYDVDEEDFTTTNIDWSVASHFVGDRATETIVQAVGLERLMCENARIDLYINSCTTASQTVLLLPDTHILKTLKPMRCYEYKWKISGTFDAENFTNYTPPVTTERSAIWGVSIHGVVEKRRRK